MTELYDKFLNPHSGATDEYVQVLMKVPSLGEYDIPNLTQEALHAMMKEAFDRGRRHETEKLRVRVRFLRESLSTINSQTTEYLTKVMTEMALKHDEGMGNE